MKFLLDILILILVSVTVGMHAPFIAAILLFLGLMMAAQYWRTLLLLGNFEREQSTGRKVKAVILALISTGFLAMGVTEGAAPSTEANISDVFNNELFSVIAMLIVLASLGLAALTTEKRKR